MAEIDEEKVRGLEKAIAAFKARYGVELINEPGPDVGIRLLKRKDGELFTPEQYTWLYLRRNAIQAGLGG